MVDEKLRSGPHIFSFSDAARSTDQTKLHRYNP
jgi:hypothetical protein